MTNEQKYERYLKKKEEKENEKIRRRAELTRLHTEWFWRLWKVRQEDKEGNLITKYQDVFEAEKKTGIDKEIIKACMKYRQKTAGGYVWKFEDYYENQRWLDKYEDKKYAKYEN